MTEEALVPQNTAMELPERLKGKTGAAGREGITSEDIQMPRLAIAQGLSPQIQEGDPLFIEGLKFGQLFNSLTGYNYGEGPIEFSIIKKSKRGVEFVPRAEGGGVKDRDVALDDPRMDWTKGPDGKKDVKPIATLFHEYLVVLSKSRELIGISMKSTNIKVAKVLNGLIQVRNQDIYEGKYKVAVVKTKNVHGTFGVYTIANAGWANDEESAELKTMFASFVSKEVIIHEGDTDDDAAPAEGEKKFDPDAKFNNEF